ncbi:restriction endonuclease [Acinetobacter qingfengensis]|uniref:Uncharacterized protein n=1 Tax=Acinetobacter qingfengensis TaxID=1262585 RepID=A0A1E7RFU1_9GAMM|nr:hypothetical protein [Acinetobacter qingfengensis]KAA8732720.1 restriction endonuclease [Acinetobacter qingfengensis]OEY98166.1 hypothetical protein BJI46_01200 [Acinetobacter qingfengensis]
MAVKTHYALLITALFGFTAVSYAGMERFWTLSGDDTEAQLSECKNLDKTQQQQLIQAYQAMRDDQQKLDLKKRMEWFCGLSEQEQQKMRLAWQNLSSKERNHLKKQFDSTTDPIKREQLRQQLITQYGSIE